MKNGGKIFPKTYHKSRNSLNVAFTAHRRATAIVATGATANTAATLAVEHVLIHR